MSRTTAGHRPTPGARLCRRGLPAGASVTARAAAAAWDPDAGSRGGDAPGDPGVVGKSSAALACPLAGNGQHGTATGDGRPVSSLMLPESEVAQVSSKTPKAAPSSGELNGPPHGAMGVSRVTRESAESAETAEMVAERSTAPAVARTATGSGVPSSAARAQTRRSSGEHDSGRSRRSSATPATSQSAESSGDDVDLATSL